MSSIVYRAYLAFFVLAVVSISPNKAFARFPADVIGRDLAITGLGSLGHIAMLTGSSTCRNERGRTVCTSIVLEVLPEGSVIFRNTFENFTSRSRVWSPNIERYWSTCQWCDHSWHGVINAGWEQRNWSPSYSLSASYVEGKLVNVRGRWVRQNARFRCDGFVVYSYLKGLARNISRNPLLPGPVWRGLPFDYSWDRGV